MKAKAARILLKYFYITNTILGLVNVSIDQSKKTVKASKLKIFYTIVWSIFFILKFYGSVVQCQIENFEVSLTVKTVGSTILLEYVIEYLVATFILLWNLQNNADLLKLFQKLLIMARTNDFRFLESSVGRQLICISIAGEGALIFLYIAYIGWMYTDGVQKSLKVNPFENSLLNSYVMCCPTFILCRYWMFLCVSIEIVRSFIVSLNLRIEKLLLDVTNILFDHSQVQEEIETFGQLYDEALRVLKLFTRVCAPIVIILQVHCMLIGINQV